MEASVSQSMWVSGTLMQNGVRSTERPVAGVLSQLSHLLDRRAGPAQVICKMGLSEAPIFPSGCER